MIYNFSVHVMTDPLVKVPDEVFKLLICGCLCGLMGNSAYLEGHLVEEILLDVVDTVEEPLHNEVDLVLLPEDCTVVGHDIQWLGLVEPGLSMEEVDHGFGLMNMEVDWPNLQEQYSASVLVDPHSNRWAYCCHLLYSLAGHLYSNRYSEPVEQQELDELLGLKAEVEADLAADCRMGN